MEKLEEIFRIQREFTKKYVNKVKNKSIEELDIDEKQQLTKEYLLNIFRETAEALNCIKFKTHRNEDDKELIIDNLHEELIDVQKYLLGLLIIWGIDSDKYFQIFNDKSKVVELRYQQEILLNNFKTEELVVCDIDGVLNDWPVPFIEHANKFYYFDNEIVETTGNPDFIKINIKTWEEFCSLPINIQDMIKHSYRMSGLKRTQNVNQIVKDFLKYVKENTNYKILLLTSRPYEKYLRIFYDTQYWLEKNEIPYDGLIFDTKKHRKLLKNLSHIKLFIDDDKSYIKNAVSVNINAMLYKNPLLIDHYKGISKTITKIFDPKKDKYEKLINEIKK